MEKNQKNRIIILLITLTLVFISITGCSPGKPEQLEKTTIAVLPWTAAAPVYVAQDQGFFIQQGLEATIQSIATGQVGINSLLDGTTDFAATADTPIASNAMSNKPIAVIATITNIDNAIQIIGKKDRGISTSGDLKGRKIGVTQGTGAEFFLNLYLSINHVSVKEVQIVNITPDYTVNALINGEVDAVSTWSPYYVELQNKLGNDATVLTDTSLYTQTHNVVVNQELTKNNPGKIQKFLRAIIQANQYIQDHPQAARSITAKYIGTDSPLYNSDWPNYHFTASLDQSLILNFEGQARWMQQRGSGATTGIPNFLNFIDTSDLKVVQPGAVRITR